MFLGVMAAAEISRDYLKSNNNHNNKSLVLTLP